MSVTTPSAVERAEQLRDPLWGGASHPPLAHIEDGAPPWKDHIYVAFWDTTHDAYGFLHWNSSPNHDTTKAQVNLSLGGATIDFIEPLPPRPDRFTSASTDFDLRSEIVYDNERLTGRLTLTPLFEIIDFGRSGALPRLGDNPPLEHFEHGLRITGTLTLDGEQHTIDAVGFRTRTWGFRDDSQQFTEYYFLWASYPDHAIGFIKQLHPDGSQKTGGALVRDGVVTYIDDVHLVKNRAGFAQRVTADLADGTALVLERGDVVWGGWCPIGLPEREGPAFSAYDEIGTWRNESGESAFGLSEYGQIRFIS